MHIPTLKRVLALFFWLAAGSFAAYGVPSQNFTVDIDQLPRTQAITFMQGSTPRLTFSLRQGGKPYTDLSGYGARFHYGPSATNATVRVDASSIDLPSGKVICDLEASDTNTNGTFSAWLIVTNSSGGLFHYSNFDLKITASSILTGADQLELGSEIDWTDTTFTGQDSGPYLVGANLTATTNGNGQVTINASAAGGISDGDKGDITVSSSGAVWSLDADAVDGTKIADDSIDSEHYVDGSIDTAHIGDAQVTAAKLATAYLPLAGGTMTGDLDMGNNVFSLDGVSSAIYKIGSNPVIMVDGSGTGDGIRIASTSGTVELVPALGTHGAGNGVIIDTALKITGVTDGTASDHAATVGQASNASNLSSGTVADARLPGLAWSYSVPYWVGPFDTGANDDAGYERKQIQSGAGGYEIAGEGITTSSATQQGRSFKGVVNIGGRTNSTQLATSNALVLEWFAEHATSTTCKADLQVWGNDGTTEVDVYSTTGLTGLTVDTANVRKVLSVARSSLTTSTLYAQYIFEVTLYTKDDAGAYLVRATVNGEAQ